MLDGIQPVSTGEIDTVGAARHVLQTEQQSASGFRLVASGDGVPQSPPPEVLRALDSAARVHGELRSRGLNVSFDTQPQGGVRVRVVDDGGQVVNEVSPTRALDVLSGDAPVEALASA